MIPVVVVSLVLVTSTLALPITTQENPITGIIGNPEIQTGIPLTTISQEIEKTGIQVSEFYTPTGQATQTVQSEYTGLNTPQQQQVEKTGYQTTSQVQTTQQQTGYVQQNTAISKADNVPVNTEEVQPVYSQNPVLLPVQPLSVVPFNPTGQVLRPVVVPAEAIADGRVVITPIGQIQQRNFHQDVYVTPESQVLHQQVSQPTTYAAVQAQVEPYQQPHYVQPVEKQTSVQSNSQGYTQVYPSQEAVNREQQIPLTNVVKQTPGSTQVQQDVQPAFTETAEKQAAYVPVQVESNPQHQVYNIQDVPQKQVVHHQTQVYTGTPVVAEYVEKQTPYQQSSEYPTQNVEPSNQQRVYDPQQTVEKQGQYQQTTGYVPAQTTPEKTEKQGQYQQGYTQTQQTVAVQPVDYVPVRTDSVHPVSQQQVYSVQPEQVEPQIPYHQTTHPQNVESVQQQVVKTSEVEPNQQVVNVIPQQVVSYAGESVYNFGEKVPQVLHNVPVQTLSSVPQTQQTFVQPSVSSIQE